MTGWVDRREGWRLVVQRAGLRLLVVAAGYCVAVGTAAAVTIAHMTIPSALPDAGMLGSLGAMLRDGPGLLMGGLMITFPTALPGFLAAIVIAARKGWRDWPPFMVAGGLNSLAALWLFGGLEGPLASGPFFVFCCVGGGLSGGFAYWVAAESGIPAWAARRLAVEVA